MPSPMLGYAPHYNDVEPYPGTPRFFAQIVDLGDNYVAALDPETGRMEVIDRPWPKGTLLEVIGFGVWHRSDPHDAAVEARVFREQNRFMAWCFSRQEPRGELGFIPLETVREINEAELVNALKAFGHNL